LGIELAASAVRTKSIEQVATAIENGTEELSSTWKDVPERHRSLRAVFEQSWQLLTENERKVLSGLAVFRAGFSADAAQQVAEATHAVLDTLLEHSLIRFNPHEECYDSHELARQYGLDKLRTQGMESDLRQRYSRYFMQALQGWSVELEGAGQLAALTKMDLELVDIRTAWDWACQHQDLTGCSQGFTGLGRYYNLRSRWFEGEHDCQAALDMLDGMAQLNPQAQRLKAQLFAYQSFFQQYTIRINPSIHHQKLEKSLQILESLQQAGEDVREDMAWILKDLAYLIPESKQAIRIAQHSLDLARQVSNKRYQALSLGALAEIYYNSGDFEEAAGYCQAALDLWLTLGDPHRIAGTLQTMGLINISRGNVQTGIQAARECVQLYRLQGNSATYAYGLSSLGLVLWFARQWEEADKVYDENIPHLQDLGDQSLVCDDSSRWSIIKMLLGQYDLARVMAHRTLELADQLSAIFPKALVNYALGGVALAQGQVEKASPFLEKAAMFIKQTGFLPDWAWALGTWSIALGKQGQLQQAQEILVQALQIGAELHSYPALSFTLPSAALLLVTTGKTERAFELCGLIDEKAMCGKTPWFEDVAGREIRQLAAQRLSPEYMQAAYERGRQRDLFATAAELLEELK